MAYWSCDTGYLHTWYVPPRNTADFGSNDETVADTVMIVGQEFVELEWRPPDKCGQRHDIKGMATRHLPHIRPELISSAP